MVDASAVVAQLEARLPRHAALLDAVRGVVEERDELRWLELGCSLGSGEGDEHSDLDIGIGYSGALSGGQLASFGASIADAVGPPVAVLVHRLDGWPSELCRAAVEYATGVQLDLVLLPAEWREGRPDRTVVLVDKDGRLRSSWTPPSRQPPGPALLREWVFLGWWALSAAAKYLKRRSLFEAADALADARKHALQLFAASASVPYAGLGLISLLDFPPFGLPPKLASTYCVPSDWESVSAAAEACADLLEQACTSASTHLSVDFDRSLAATARSRLRDARDVIHHP